MTDYAKLFLDAQRLAGALSLYGVADNELSRRVFAGMRDAPGYEDCGKIEAHNRGVALGQLYTTHSSGEVRLKGRTAWGSFTGLLLGCSRIEGFGGETWGFIRLLAMNPDRGRSVDVVQITTDPDRLRGRIFQSDSDPHSASYADLGLDAEGPYLKLGNGIAETTISPRGIRVWPLKEEAFVADHPTDPELEIHYNVLEGPEVGVYARGTARLVRGHATVTLPDHFAAVTSPDNGLTAQLTPRSADSKGVAATTLSVRELVIEELLGGVGNYDVDWAVHGIRKGAEEFEVLRPKRFARRRPAAPRNPGPVEQEGDEAL